MQHTTKSNYKRKTSLAARFSLPLHGNLRELDLLAFLQPLHEGAEAAGRDHDALLAAGGRVDDHALLQIRHLAALGLNVGVAHVVSSHWGFAGNGADFRHRGCFKTGPIIAQPKIFGKRRLGVGGKQEFCEVASSNC